MAMLSKKRTTEKREVETFESLKELHAKHPDANCSYFPNIFINWEIVVFKGYAAEEWNIYEEEKKVI